jgi:hypothetical protein
MLRWRGLLRIKSFMVRQCVHEDKGDRGNNDGRDDARGMMHLYRSNILASDRCCHEATINRIVIKKVSDFLCCDCMVDVVTELDYCCYQQIRRVKILSR